MAATRKVGKTAPKPKKAAGRLRSRSTKRRGKRKEPEVCDRSPVSDLTANRDFLRQTRIQLDLLGDFFQSLGLLSALGLADQARGLGTSWFQTPKRLALTAILRGSAATEQARAQERLAERLDREAASARDQGDTLAADQLSAWANQARGFASRLREQARALLNSAVDGYRKAAKASRDVAEFSDAAECLKLAAQLFDPLSPEWALFRDTPVEGGELEEAAYEAEQGAAAYLEAAGIADIDEGDEDLREELRGLAIEALREAVRLLERAVRKYIADADAFDAQRPPNREAAEMARSSAEAARDTAPSLREQIETLTNSWIGLD